MRRKIGSLVEFHQTAQSINPLRCSPLFSLQIVTVHSIRKMHRNSCLRTSLLDREFIGIGLAIHHPPSPFNLFFAIWMLLSCHGNFCRTLFRLFHLLHPTSFKTNLPTFVLIIRRRRIALPYSAPSSPH